MDTSHIARKYIHVDHKCRVNKNAGCCEKWCYRLKFVFDSSHAKSRKVVPQRFVRQLGSRKRPVLDIGGSR